MAERALYVLGMLAGQPLASLTWHIRGGITVRSWMLKLPRLRRLELRVFEDAPATISLRGRDLTHLTCLTELVIGHGSCDLDLRDLCLPTSLQSLGLR